MQAELRAKPGTRYVPVCEGDSAVTAADDAQHPAHPLRSSQLDPDGRPVRWQPALLPHSDIQRHLDTHTGSIFLGLDSQGDAVFAASIAPGARESVAKASQAGEPVQVPAGCCLGIWGCVLMPGSMLRCNG